MFAHLLEEPVRFELLQIARLLYSLEVPLLWDGKTSGEITGSTNLKNISFKFSEAQKNSWDRFYNDYRNNSNYVDKILFDKKRLDEKFLNEIKEIPIIYQNDIERRLQIALNILKKDVLKKMKNINLTQSRIVMFELIRSCFNCGGVTDFKRNLLQFVSIYYGIEGESFNELLTQAAKLDKELKRSINLVLE